MPQLQPFPYSRDLEYSLAFHCAPALAGLKAANLVSLSRDLHPNLPQEISRFSRRLRGKGILCFRLAECTKRILLLVCHSQTLACHLSRAENREFLAQCGYHTDTANLAGLLERLGKRICAKDGEYPHEIGVFLGYPLGDIQGFIAHRGACYRLNGYWKVYGDPDEAKQRFATYDRARSYYCQCVQCGEKIHTIHTGGMFA